MAETAPARLYDFPFSGNGYKIRLAMTQLGLPYNYRVVDIVRRETREPWFLKLNPMGQIPVLQLADGTVLAESNAILFFLAEGTRLMPADRLGRARLVQWMNFEQSNIDKVLGRTRFLLKHPDFMPTTRAYFEELWAHGHAALAVVEQALAGRDFLVGEAYSAADICLYGYIHTGQEGGFDLSRYPNVQAWLARVRGQPGHIPIDAHG